MDSGHTSPSVLARQPSQPRVQEQSPPLVGSEQTDNGGRLRRDSTEMPLIGSSMGHSPPRDRNYPHPDLEPTLQFPAATRGRDGHMTVSQRIAMGYAPSTYGLDHVVPVVEKHHLGTLGARLDPTIESAKAKKTQYEITGKARVVKFYVEVPIYFWECSDDVHFEAKWTSYTLNIAIGVQVLLGALTTGLAAASPGKQTLIAISVLGACLGPLYASFFEDHISGGLSTVVASYLARARGSNEPELSITRVKNLDRFLRECYAFVEDHGFQHGGPGSKLDNQLCELRREFEELLGNGDG
ncbi:hypothetical protein AZE42_04928 [Rhizopogon vesiculosus]|uniref:SMODS and SLOG-associating 2TM effector domain-containing protein n=1 Tax=Rhizopogon vesiculosus TaxID=180088 RepID=A0A1J8PQA8_9AGAM|nr:hypothetical protein AZE42_04928 [Rhizopogon vesiculosus]